MARSLLGWGMFLASVGHVLAWNWLADRFGEVTVSAVTAVAVLTVAGFALHRLFEDDVARAPSGTARTDPLSRPTAALATRSHAWP